jgi:hypothetical protein
MDANRIPPWKYVMAGFGVATLVVGAGYILWFMVQSRQAHSGPTELTLHPERQNEILAQRRTESIAERLALTPEQSVEVAAMLEEFVTQRNAERVENAGNLLGTIQSRRAAMQRLDSQMQAILTPEQQKNFTAMKAELVNRAGQLQQFRPLLGNALPQLPQGIVPTAPAAHSQE